MKRSCLFLSMVALVFTVSLALPGLAQNPIRESDRILGKWETKSGDNILIYKEGDQYFGRPVLKPGEVRLDEHNPDESLRDRSLNDIINMKNFRYTKKDFWSGGTIYDPNNGKTYKCHITMESLDTIKVRGYIGFSLLGRTEVWSRVANKKQK
jgi:uncharacterized protein (DUF2147 family)